MENISLQSINNASLLNHIKSADFFEVETYPTAKLVINQFDSINDPETKADYTAFGYLTIKDVSKPIDFPVELYEQGGEIIGSAQFSIDRTKRGITYGSDNFFDNLGDDLVGDMIDFEIDLVLK